MSAKATNLSALATETDSVVDVAARHVTAQVHVLIADGDEHSLMVWGSQLLSAGFRVTRARTGFEAIVKASCHLPDVIVLGEPLSDIGATETDRMITTCPVTAHIPVVRVMAGQKLPRRILTIARQAAL